MADEETEGRARPAQIDAETRMLLRLVQWAKTAMSDENADIVGAAVSGYLTERCEATSNQVEGDSDGR